MERLDIKLYKKIRKMWLINPFSKVKKSKKIYNRKKEGRKLKKELGE